MVTWFYKLNVWNFFLWVGLQARNQDFIWGGANEAKVDQTTEMYF